jgi:ElaB/YqjD/DUF883 family membrane-anchored ribosome-binding protein
MAIHEPQTEEHASVKEQARELFHDLSTELKEEIQEIRTGEQPVKPQADLFVRKHVMGLIGLLFGLVAVILLVAIAVIAVYGHGHI